MKKFLREFLAALAFHCLCLAWHFRELLLTTGVDALQAKPPHQPDTLRSFSEMVYIAEASIITQAKLIHQGIFPAWTPYAAAGTPLIGKMQNGLFALHHLLLYIGPLRWLPYLLTSVVALKLLLGFAFTYLFARSLGLGFLSGTLAGTWFAFSGALGGGLANGEIFTWPGAALDLPLILLLIELYFKGHKGSARLLLPWAFAIPFLSGHFESAVHINLAALGYFTFRLWRGAPEPGGTKLRQWLVFAGLQAVGAAIAAIQIVPAMEYVNNSYSKLWHSASYFGFWDLDTVGKHLSGADVPMLLLGWLGLVSAFLVAKKTAKKADFPMSARHWASGAAAAALLALGLACLFNVGLDRSLQGFSGSGGDSILSWLLGAPALVLAAWIAVSPGQPEGIKALGWLMLASAFLKAKVPPVSNVVLALPTFHNFHNSIYRWDYILCRSVLLAAGLERCLCLAREPWSDRWRRALAVFWFTLLAVCAYAASLRLEGPVGIRVASAVVPVPGQDPASGGLMMPERNFTYRRTYVVSGWIPFTGPDSAVKAGLVDGQNTVAAAPITTDSISEGRRYFHATLEPPSRPALNLRAVVGVLGPNGAMQVLKGGNISFLRYDPGVAHDAWIVLAAALGAPLLLLCGRALLGLALAAALAGPLALQKAAAIPAGEIPYRLPGISWIKGDPGLFRVSSLDYNFLQADYSSVYDLGDIRTGGDSIDVLTAIYYFHLMSNFLSNEKSPADLEVGLRLLGLAGVKYLAQPPDDKPRDSGLQRVYQGWDMSVYKNAFYKPLALFYDKYSYFPLGDFTDWKRRGQFMIPLISALAQKKLDLDATLLLNDMPDENVSTARDDPRARSSVAVEEHSPNRVRLRVEAARPGFVFLSDTYFPGWVASVNGQRTKTLRSWINFRAVQVPRGASVVEFSYRPWPLWAATALTAAISIAWLFLYQRHLLSPAAPREEPASAAPPKKKKKAAMPERAQEEAPPATEACARVAVGLFGTLILLNLGFWAFWSAFVYAGGLWIRLPACALLAAFFGGFLRGFIPGCSVAAKPTSASP